MDGALQFFAVERLAPPCFLDHRQLAQLHALKRGEPAAAGRAQPPPPDSRVVVGGPAIFHLGVVMSAERAAHGKKCLSCSSIDGETLAQREHALLYALFNRGIAVLALG